MCSPGCPFEKAGFEAIYSFKTFRCKIFPTNAYHRRCDQGYIEVEQAEALLREAGDEAVLSPMRPALPSCIFR